MIAKILKNLDKGGDLSEIWRRAGKSGGKFSTSLRR